MNNSLEQFNNPSLFTYKKLANDLMPTTVEHVQSIYPYPKKDGVPYSYFAHYGFPVRLLSPEFMKWLVAAGMTPHHAEIFYRPGTGELMDAFIHTDGHQLEIDPGLAKINFILGGETNIMKWWRPVNGVTDENKKLTKANTQYLMFEESECKLVDEVEMNGLYVVNAGIPHSVTMNSAGIDNPRICMSVVPRLISGGTNTYLGCQEVYDRLTEAGNRLFSSNK
jgi:hypothetical protein